MKYGFLGAGKMAQALIRGMLRAELCLPAEILAASRDRAALEKFAAGTGISVSASNTEAAAGADAVILCVKPFDAATALSQTAEGLRGKLLISVVTGLSIQTLKKHAPDSRILRTMPNTAALVGKSATALADNAELTAKDRETGEGIFKAVGQVFNVPESKLDAVTGLSGSGPAYVCLVIEALADGGVAVGLPRKLALELAIQTVAGTAEMAASSGEHPAILREMVTSPGGTTIEALAKLEAAAVRSAFIEAVKASTRRSRELSGE